MKIKKTSVFVVAYALPVFLLSVYLGFAYFVDSKTYLAGFPAPVVAQVAQLYPVSVIVLAVGNFILLAKFFHSSGVLFRIVLLHPYGLLLIFNLTKEQSLFFALFLSTSLLWKRRRFFSRLMLVVTVARPIYFFGLLAGWFAFRLRQRYLLATVYMGLAATLVIVVGRTGLVEMFSDLLAERSHVGHTGRDFYNYLCVKEKADLGEFVSCWVPVFVGIPIHEDTLSLRWLTYAIFQVPLVISLFKVAYTSPVRGVASILGVSALSFIILGWSPTFGAYVRYFLPVIWIYFLFELGASWRRNVRSELRRSAAILAASRGVEREADGMSASGGAFPTHSNYNRKVGAR